VVGLAEPYSRKNIEEAAPTLRRWRAVREWKAPDTWAGLMQAQRIMTKEATQSPGSRRFSHLFSPIMQGVPNATP
jgi:hypothetical protein